MRYKTNVNNIIVSLRNSCLILLSLILLSCNSLFAQDIEYHFESITTSEGLSQNSVFSIAQDSDGFMWFGTQSGLDRYDGVEFINYRYKENNSKTIPKGNITKLFFNPNTDMLWAASSEGICRINIRDNRVQRFDLDSLIEESITDIAGDTLGNIWVVSAKRIYRVHDNNSGTGIKVDRINIEGDVNCITICENGVLALLGMDSGVFAFNLHTSEVTGKVLEGKADNFQKNVKQIYLYKDSFIATVENVGAYIAKLTTDKKTYSAKAHFAKWLKQKSGNEKQFNIRNLSCVLETKDGNLWISTNTNNYGICIYENIHEIAHVISPKHSQENFHSLTSPQVLSLFQSDDHTIWVGTNGGGISKLISRRPIFRHYSVIVDSSSSNVVWSIHPIHRDTLLVGTDGNGVVKTSISNSKYTKQFWKKQGTSNTVKAIISYDNDLYLGTYGGLYYLKEKKVDNEVEVSKDSITCLLPIENILVAGTANGKVLLLDKGVIRDEHQDSLKRWIRCITVSNNGETIYVGTSNGVLSYNMNKYLLEKTLDTFKTYGILSIAQVDSVLLIGTHGKGLIEYNLKTNRTHNFDKNDGLIDDVINAIIVDSNKNCWLSSNKGLISYNRTDSAFNSYTRKHGLQHDEFNLDASYYNEKYDPELIFFGGVNGVSSVSNFNIPKKKEEYNCKIIRYKLGDGKHTFSQETIKDNQTVYVEPSTKQITFFIRLSDYHDVYNNQYKYSLNGGGWSRSYSLEEPIMIPSEEMSSSFQKNKLKIIVRSGDGRWKAVKAITIKKEYNWLVLYLTFALITVVFLFYTLYRSRRKIQRKVDEINEKNGEIENTNKTLEKQVRVINEKNILIENYNNALKKIALTESELADAKGHLFNAITLIEDYFENCYVSIWLKGYSKGTPDKVSLFTTTADEYYQVAASELVQDHCVDYGMKNINLKDALPEYEILPIARKHQKGIYNPFRRFAIDEHLSYMIHVPLFIHGQRYGFVNIYLNEHRGGNFFQTDKDFLKIVLDKAIIRYVAQKIVDNFSSISQSFFKVDQLKVLKKIVNSARELLHSDLVLLYLLDAESNKILYKKTVYDGAFYDEDKIKEGRKANFIDILLKEEANRYFESQKDLPKAYQKLIEVDTKGIDTFWKRERIASMAAIVLKVDQQVIGVMCFNYRQKQSFHPVTKQIIETFSSLAAVRINNVNNLNKIKAQENEIAKLLKESEFKYQETYEKMQDMLPLSNASSLIEIIRAVNHDIRNHLLKLQTSIIGIKDDSHSYKKIISRLPEIKADIANASRLMNLFSPESFRISIESIDEIIKEVSAMFNTRNKGSEKGIIVDVKQLNIEGTFRCSKAIVSMIIYNLLSNAYKAIIELWKKNGKANPSGQKTISPEGEIIITTQYDDSNYYCISVQDNGIGIDKDNISNIYIAGWTTSENGKGIGLFFVKETVEKLFDGEIYCESDVNKGTKFTIRLKQQRDNIDHYYGRTTNGNY